MTQAHQSFSEEVRLANLSSAAKHVAEFAASATNRAFVALLDEAKTEVVKDQLATAELGLVPGLQWQIQLMRSLITVANGRPKMLMVRSGTVSAIDRTGIKGRVVAKAVTTGANGTVQADGDWTDIYTAAAVVTLFNARGVSIGTGTVASSALAGGVTTVTFDATGVNASFAVGMQMGVVNTMRTIPSRTNGVIEMPPESVVRITYSAAPTVTISDASF